MKIEELLRRAVRAKHYSLSTERAYVQWYQRFVRFHLLKHPELMGDAEVEAFLSSLANDRHVSASTQNQALSALLFLYASVIGRPLGKLDAVRAKRAKRLPVVLTRTEIGRLLSAARGETGLVLALLYGTGARLMEAMRLRVKDVDFGQNQIALHDTKHGSARFVMLPLALREELSAQIERMRLRFEQDRNQDVPGVWLPDALSKKYPNAGTEWPWQWVFGSDRLSRDPRTGIHRRHHINENAVQKAIHRAVKLAGIPKAAHVHSLRHSAATHWLEAGYDIRTVQELLGHKNVETTMVYTHVMAQPSVTVRSPLDLPADNLPEILSFPSPVGNPHSPFQDASPQAH